MSTHARWAALLASLWGGLGCASGMEAFESFVAVALEAEGFIVSPAVKFRVQRQTKKAAHIEVQTHGYEVDLVAARARRLVLATVKSFFGSGGVAFRHVTGDDKTDGGRYRLLNDPVIRDEVVAAAAARYGYHQKQVELRLYVGHFAGGKKVDHEARIREWAASQRVGRGAIRVFGVDEVVGAVREEAAAKQYRDNPVLVTMKVLEAAGRLRPEPADAEGGPAT